jgi:hypothetical protein
MYRCIADGPWTIDIRVRFFCCSLSVPRLPTPLHSSHLTPRERWPADASALPCHRHHSPDNPQPQPRLASTTAAPVIRHPSCRAATTLCRVAPRVSALREKSVQSARPTTPKQNTRNSPSSSPRPGRPSPRPRPRPRRPDLLRTRCRSVRCFAWPRHVVVVVFSTPSDKRSQAVWQNCSSFHTKADKACMHVRPQHTRSLLTERRAAPDHGIAAVRISAGSQRGNDTVRTARPPRPS